MQSKIIVIALCLGVASAAVWIGKNPPKPPGFEDKEGCYIEEIKDVIPFRKIITPIGNCVRITCGEMIDYASCGVVMSGSDNCYVTEPDLTKPYPDCCPDVKCVEENQIENHKHDSHV